MASNETSATRRAVAVAIVCAVVCLLAVLPAAAGPPAVADDAAVNSDVVRPGGWSGELAWEQHEPVTSPSARTWAASAYYATKNVIVLFGGGTAQTLSDETWIWNGSTWRERDLRSGPIARYYHASAYDPVRDEVILYGGISQGVVVLNDAWSYDGNWTRRQPSTHPDRYGAAMAFDPHMQQILMFGGYDWYRARQETYAWDGTNWILLSPATSPPRRAFTDLVYDPKRDALVFFGGYRSDKVFRATWSWDGATWTKETLSRRPPARYGHSLATVGGRVVLFGGVDQDGAQLGDTWVLGRTKWRNLSPVESPTARHGASLDWDPVRREAVLFGGAGTDALFDDTWTLSHSLASTGRAPKM